ncbi:MAG: hypothetical protein M3Y67_03440 [Pseudomonadota bacterium]|nr:hypothetical protein [Pseudomonadota bacterium]
MFFLLAHCNEKKSSNGAVSGLILVTTMKSQQAVANTFCWKARQSFDVPFFCFSMALRAFTSLRDMGLR